MSDYPIFKLILFIIFFVGYLFAFIKQKNKKHTFALFLLVGCGLLLRIYASMDVNLHPWDERYHALVAKHLVSHFLHPTLYENPVLPIDYSNFKDGNTWLHKQPLTLWLIALSLKIFGFHGWAVRIPSIVLSTIGIKLIYDIAKYLYGNKIAFIAAFLYSINGLIIDLTSGRTATDHVDMAFLFFILLSVWFTVKNEVRRYVLYVLLIGVSMGCAILCKWLPAMIIIPIWVLIFCEKEKNIKIIAKNLFLILTAAILIFLPWQLYILNHFRDEALWEYRYNSMHLWQVLADQGGNWFYHFNCLRINYGELVYIPIIWFSITTLKERKLYDVAHFLWFWIPYLFFSFCATKMQAYTVFAAPAVFIMTAKLYQYIVDKCKQKIKWRWVFLVIAYGLILLPIRFSLERLKCFDNTIHQYPKWEKDIETFKTGKLNTPKTVVFNCEHNIELMFETDCTAYSVLPDSLTIQQTKNRGYNVVIW